VTGHRHDAHLHSCIVIYLHFDPAFQAWSYGPSAGRTGETEEDTNYVVAGAAGKDSILGVSIVKVQLNGSIAYYA
jgi:hypothetical protein